MTDDTIIKFTDKVPRSPVALALSISSLVPTITEHPDLLIKKVVLEGNWKFDGGSKRHPRLTKDIPCEKVNQAERLFQAFERLKTDMEKLGQQNERLEDNYYRHLKMSIGDDNTIRVDFGSPSELEIARKYLVSRDREDIAQVFELIVQASENSRQK